MSASSTSISCCIWQNPGASASGWNVAWASFFRPACRCCTSRVKTASIRCAPAELLGAFDIGPTRTLQQDVEFGVIQIVDIALRAISPAVNDPSTAISCIDQLSRILIRWLGRAPPASVLFDPPHVPRVFVPWISVDGMFDTAFEQIRHYAANDAAVSLRLLRAIGDIAGTLQQDDTRAKLLERARRVVDGCSERLGEAETARLKQRLDHH